MSRHKNAARFISSIMLCALALTTADAQAQSKARSGAIGIGLGQGTGVWGLSFKTVRGDTAIEVVGGRAGGQGFGVNLSGLYEIPPLAVVGPLELGLNAGAGGAIGAGNDFVFAAASGIIGLEFNLLPIPLDLVLDWRPTLVILPEFRFHAIGFGGHIRFYF